MMLLSPCNVLTWEFMRIKKRIELEKIKFTRSVRLPENNDENGEKDPAEENKSNAFEFTLEGETLDNHGPQTAAVVTDETGRKHPAMGGWPETEITFSVTEEDLPRVNAWFTDDYHNVSVPESATLQKNRASALHNALKSYFSTAAASNLFTSPFRLGWRFVYRDGSIGNLNDAGILYTFSTAPQLPLTSASISGKNLYTRAQVRNVPSRLKLRLNPDSEITLDQIKETVERIEIYTTEQTPLYDSNAEVAGIRTITIDGTPKRCWYYTRYDSVTVLNTTRTASDFRLISTIFSDEIGNFSEFSNVPIAIGAFSGFSKLPKPDSTSGTEPAIPAGSIITIITEPLHLDQPDADKSLRSVAVRGVFPRDKIRTRIFGSQHREEWHLIADVSGPFVSGIHGARFRWFRIEIEYPQRDGDFVDAISFG